MIVGRFLGPDAWGCCWGFLFYFWFGNRDLPLVLENGMGVVIARYYGAQKYDKLRQSVAATLVIGLGLSVLVMFLGHFGLYPLLTF